MEGHVYKTIHLTGSSSKSMEDAVQLAIKKASESIHNLRWFEVIETRGAISGNGISEWQVTVKIGFTVD